jgi:polyhydroxybutyrate depolymerase
MSETLAVGGRDRTFTVVGSPDAPAARPLILVFHGSRQTGATHRAFTGSQLDALADDGRAVVAYLDGYRGNWNDARRQSAFPARREGIDDVGFVRAVVERLRRTHGIDETRVIVVGYSNGGQMVMRLLHEVPDLVAGAVIVAAAMPGPGDFLAPEPAPPARPVPIAVIHGTRDPIVPYDGGEMRRWARIVFRVGGRTLSAPDTATYFAARMGLSRPPVTEPLPAAFPAATHVDLTSYGADGSAAVTLYTVHGGGHTVPGPHRGPGIVGRTNSDISVAGIVTAMLDEQERAAA